MAISDYFAQTPTQLPSQPSGAAQVTGTLENIVGSNSAYIQNARRRGLETAAARGGINSSIAAGAAERSAIEAAQPLVQQAVNIDQADRQAQTENWLSQQNFGRALYGQTFSNSLSMLNAIQQYGLDDPELYTPEVLSGYTNFFQRNMGDLLSRYFGG